LAFEACLNLFPQKKDLLMDFIHTAITSFFAFTAAEVSKEIIKDAYEQLKNTLFLKGGADSEVAKALLALEDKPTSKSRQGVLQEELKEANLDSDEELIALSKILLEKMNGMQIGKGNSTQQAVGSYIAQADRQSTASVNVNAPSPSNKKDD
jgi:hypothetical protein